MLHMRAVSPAELTDAVLGILHEQPGATHVVLLRGAAVEPVTDSPVTVVAMVVGPEFGPLAALAVGLVRRRWPWSAGP